MAQRPDSPTDEQADAPLPEDEPTVHHVSQRKKRKKGVGGEEIQLQLTSMIDVIFQLLIYFVITANFMIDEGTILATLPGNAAPTNQPPPPVIPVNIEMTSADDGVTYTLTVDNNRIDGVTQLYAYLKSQNYDEDQQVQIKPQGDVRWQHVVNVFNACVRAELSEIGFAPSPMPGS
ncbi:MAG: ExbD/TolR family protein [Phycisphaeraceae bacterium]